MNLIRPFGKIWSALLWCVAMSVGSLSGATFKNPVIADGADPWVTYKDGYYYYTQTTGWNVSIRKATNLTQLASAPEVSVFVPAAPYNQGVWAPELHYLQGKWYIYFAADNGTNANHRMFVAERNNANPQGAFTAKGKIYDSTTDRWAIDGTVLEKEDGSLYFVWSGWPGAVDGKQNLYISPMSNPWTISGPRVLISTPTLGWESWINEGPEVIRRNGKYFIFYSASGSWTDDYCFGLLSCSNGNVTNAAAWTKGANPIFKKYADANGGVYGPGHGSITKSADGTEDWLFYHAAKSSGSGWTRNVRLHKFTWNADDSPNFGTPLLTNVAVTVPSGEGTNVLAAAATEGGSVSTTANLTNWVQNAAVTLTATNTNRWVYFYGWSGINAGRTNPVTVKMTNSQAITALYTNEIVVDNPAAFLSGFWSNRNSAGDKYASNYVFAATTNGPPETATYFPEVPLTAKYDVFTWYPAGANRSTNAPFLISSWDGDVTVGVNQQINGGGWRLLAAGKFFEKGTNGFIRLASNTGEPDKVVLADGIKLRFAAEQNYEQRLGAAGLDAQGKMQLSLRGSPGVTNVVEVSTNLTVWTPLTNLVVTNAAMTWTDPHPEGMQRFYRVRPK